MTDAALANDLTMSDHDMIVVLRERSETNTKRIGELIEWKHGQLPPVVAGMQRDILTLSRDTGTLRGEVSALCATVEKLAATVTLLLPVIGRQEDHEKDCLELAHENIRHREGFENRVNARFDAGEAAREKVREKIDATRNWVIGIGGMTLLTVLSGTIAVIWSGIQHGGLSLFAHP